MDGMEALLGLLIWAVLLVGAWMLGPMQTHHSPGRVALVATWFLVTLLTLAYGSVVIFVVVHLMLFTLGTGAAAIGIVVSGLLLLATPVAWAIAVRSVARHLDAQGRTGQPSGTRGR